MKTSWENWILYVRLSPSSFSAIHVYQAYILCSSRDWKKCRPAGQIISQLPYGQGIRQRCLPTTSLKEVPVTKICPRQVQFQSYLSQGQTGVNLFIKPCSSTKNSTKILQRKATNLCCGNGSIIHEISLLSSGETPTFVNSRTILKAYIKYGPAIPTVALRI